MSPLLNRKRNDMNAFLDTLKKIERNSETVDVADVRRVMVLYEEEIVMLGDYCIKFDKIRYVEKFFPNAILDVHYTESFNAKYFDGFLRHNPYVKSVCEGNRETISFEHVDVLLCASHQEEELLNFLHARYGEKILQDKMKLAVFSISGLILHPNPKSRFVFPINEKLLKTLDVPGPCRIYMSNEEKMWADRWLALKGLESHENLIVAIDSSAVKSKLLSIDVFFDFLRSLLDVRGNKILIFDERNAGKNIFYSAWLGAEYAKRLIFSNGLTLREDLALLGSSNVGLIVGPCTGLMHCSSAIYNHYVAEGMSLSDVPLIITYTGRFENDNYDVPLWWGNSPLVDCLLIKERNNKKEMLLLDSLSEQDKLNYSALPCSEYSADMLLTFVNGKIRSRAHTTRATDMS